MNKIYVMITGPGETKRAIHKAVELCSKLDLQLVALNVIDQESVAKLQRYKIFIEEESSLFTESLKKDAEKYLNYAEKTAKAAGVSVHTELLEGDPFAEVFEYIRNDDADFKLICVARRKDATLMKESFGNLEKKMLLKTPFDFVVAGTQEAL